MGFREGYSLPEDCELRQHFPKGIVYVQTSGAEGPEGPTHVNLYDRSFEEVPRVPVLHATMDRPSSIAAHELEMRLIEAHNDGGCNRALGCLALFATSLVPHEDMPGVRAPEPSVVG